MLHAFEFSHRDNTRFTFFLCLSILGHIVVLICALPNIFPNLKDELPTEAKLKALTVQITQVYSDYHAPVIAMENVEVNKVDIAEVKPALADTTEANIAEANSIETETVETETIEPDPKSEYADESNSGSKLESILNEKYYSLAELDQIPEAQTNIDIDSLNLLNFAQGGEVSLRLWVDEFGQVVNVEVINSEMPQTFVDSAIKLFLQAQLSIGMVNNNPVKFVTKVVIRYEPH